MIGRNSRHQPFSQINMVPYLDVMLVLLIIFMMVVPAVQSGLKVELPGVKKTLNNQGLDSQSVTLWLDEKGQRWLSRGEGQAEKVADDEWLIRWFRQRSVSVEHQVMIKAHRLLSWEQVVKSMANLRVMGWKKVVLVTEPIK